MTRKDYIAIAEAIRKTALDGGMEEASREAVAQQAAVEQIAKDIARVMAADNPRFEVSKFLEACGV